MAKSARHQRQWLPYEERLLYTLYIKQNMTAEDTAVILRRPRLGVVKKINELGFRKTKPQPEFYVPEPTKIASERCYGGPGSEEKVDAITKRFADGVKLWHPDDEPLITRPEAVRKRAKGCKVFAFDCEEPEPESEDDDEGEETEVHAWTVAVGR